MLFEIYDETWNSSAVFLPELFGMVSWEHFSPIKHRIVN